MRKQYLYIISFISLLSATYAEGQTDISMATHWNNRANYNPAFIARPDYLYLFCNTRHQWVGVNGAPVVFNIQASEYIQNVRSAFGISFVDDKIGATQSYNPMMTYAFRIAKKKKWALAMGLSAGIFVRSIDGSALEADNTSDPTLFDFTRRITQPDLNVGFEFQNTHFIYGIATTHLLSISKSDTLYLNTNHRYGYIIYRNESNKTFNYSAGIQVVNRYNLTIIEGNIDFRLKRMERLLKRSSKGQMEVFDVGITCRTSRELTLLCGIMLSPYLRIGYAYDQSLVTKYSQYGTHEVMLEYRIPARSASTVSRCGGREFWYR